MKIHLQRTDEPLIAGADIKAACEEVVPNAAFVLIADTTFAEVAHLNSLAACSKCFAVRGVGRYLYALAAGQEVLTEGA